MGHAASINATRVGPRQRLAIVTPVHAPGCAGGSEQQIGYLIDSLASGERFEVHYLASATDGGRPRDDYRLVHLAARTGLTRSAPRLGYLMHAPSLNRALRSIAPHVIYQRVACGYSGVCAWYARNHGARLVWHVAHDSDVTPGESLDGRNPVRKLLEKRSVEYAIWHADTIVAQTCDQARRLACHYGREANVIPNFHPDPVERIDKSGRLTVVWIASLKPWKRPEAFLRLAKALRDLREVRFVMAGPAAVGAGERSWADDLRRRIEAAAPLEYLGALPQNEVHQLLAHAHLLVNTSRQEGFPNTFIQAWQREAVVISLEVDPDGVLERRRMGIGCGGSEAHLAEAVRGLLGNEARRREYAARARAHARAQHSIANARELAQLLEEAPRGEPAAAGLHP